MEKLTKSHLLAAIVVLLLLLGGNYEITLWEDFLKEISEHITTQILDTVVETGLGGR
jgi:hypothetical protein